MQFKRVIASIKQHGLRYTWGKIRFALCWYNYFQRRAQQCWGRSALSRLSETDRDSILPAFSIVVPVFNPALSFAVDLLESVQKQTYQHWQLCIADASDASRTDLEQLFREAARLDPRITYHRLIENCGIAVNSNEAIKLAHYSWIALLDHDDVLAPDALARFAEKIEQFPEADFLFSNELTFAHCPQKPMRVHLKPCFAPDTLRSNNYICHLTAFRRSLLEEVGSFRSGFEGSQDYDLFLRLTERAQCVKHVSALLYGWRVHAKSVSSGITVKPYCIESGVRAISEQLVRLGRKGTVEPGESIGTYRIRYDFPDSLTVTEVVYDEQGLICVRHHDLKARVLLNDERIINSGNSLVADLNKAGMHCETDLLLFVDKAYGFVSYENQTEMAMLAQFKESGPVGAKLLDKRNRILEAGLFWRKNGSMGVLHRHFAANHAGYMGRLSFVQNVSAVSEMCLMIRTDHFKNVGGFDERFCSHLFGIDLCLRLAREGRMTIWTPYAELKCHSDFGSAKKRNNQIETADTKLFASIWNSSGEKCDPFWDSDLAERLEKTF